MPYVANINAEVVTDCGKIEGLLVAQVSGSVRWQQSVETMIREGVDTFVEIGPGKTLTGFLRKIDKNVKAYHIGSWGRSCFGVRGTETEIDRYSQMPRGEK